MRASDLRPAGQLAANFGAKCLVYGPPGKGKTPVLNTAPRPVLLAVEPGLASMRGSTVPAWFAPDVPRIEEFMRFLFESHEGRQYETVAIDSLSQVAELYLAAALGQRRDGRKAYGDMSEAVMRIANALFYRPACHVYIIAKEGTVELGAGLYRRPFFPGQDLNVKIPHLYDAILRLDSYPVPHVGTRVMFRTRCDDGTMMARDRSGQLNEYEAPNLSTIFAKCMQVSAGPAPVAVPTPPPAPPA